MRTFFGIPFSSPKELRERGILSLNQRNAEFILPNNKRKFYSQVDSKLETKIIANNGGIPTPEAYAIVKSNQDIRSLQHTLEGKSSFVIKPDRGSGGKGILVITGKSRHHFLKPSGAEVSWEQIRFHLTNILGGLFSLGGRRDQALIEYCITSDQELNALSYMGAPDIRIILYKGYPVMAMLRSATRQSDGKANLHMGGIGIGVNLTTGKTSYAIHDGKSIREHPDTYSPIIDFVIPHWEKIIDIATKASSLTKIVYMGVDLMLDKDHGPLLIEMNARPGLAIQLANNTGLVPRLRTIDQRANLHPDESIEEKIHFSQSETFAST